MKDMHKGKGATAPSKTPKGGQRPKPKLVKVEEGGGSSTRTDEEEASYTKLFDQAVKSGDWTEVLKHKSPSIYE